MSIIPPCLVTAPLHFAASLACFEHRYPLFVMQTTPPCSNKHHYNYKLTPNKAAALLAVNATDRQQQKGNEHAAKNHYASLP